MANKLAKQVKDNSGLKVLGTGELTNAITVKAAKFSASAKEAIEKAGREKPKRSELFAFRIGGRGNRAFPLRRAVFKFRRTRCSKL